MSDTTTFKGIGITDSKDWQNQKFMEFESKPFRDHDVMVKIHCCGVCGSDLHTVKGEWQPIKDTQLIAGHEMIGEVVKLGKKVDEFKLGQIVGVGSVCNCCHTCPTCTGGTEQYCPKFVMSYGAIDHATGYLTKGGFASHYVANSQFVFPIPENLPEEYAAPLMCAGLTVFSPLYENLGDNGAGKTVGIIGIGGLGHLGIMFAKALGAKVIAFSRSSSKKDECINEFGADDFVATGEDPNWVEKYERSIDFYIYCASGMDVDLNAYMRAAKLGGNWICVGAPDMETNVPLHAITLLANKASISGSVIGNKKEAIKMLQVAAEHNIKPWIEKVPISEENVGKVLERLEKGDVRYRFVMTDFDKVFD